MSVTSKTSICKSINYNCIRQPKKNKIHFFKSRVELRPRKKRFRQTNKHCVIKFCFRKRGNLECNAAVGSASESFNSGEGIWDEKEGDRSALYVRGTVRAGQNLKHPGSIIVYGDVNAGGSVVAGGDVIVWGRLRGDASAGSSGSGSGVIVALQMEPSLLSIAGVPAYGPKGGASASLPEKAALVQDSDSQTSRIRIAPAFQWSKVADIRSSQSADASKTNNTAAIQAAYITGAYIALAGISLTLFPVQVFSLLFDMRFISSGWVRVFGVLATVFGIYYLGTAYGDTMGANARAFYVSTVVGRLYLFFSFCMLVATKRFAEPALLLLGLINFIGAMLMYNALQKADSA